MFRDGAWKGWSKGPGEGTKWESGVTLKPLLQIKNTNADANGAILEFIKDSASPADDDQLGLLRWKGDDSGGTETVFASIEALSLDVTDTTEDGALLFKTVVAGSLTEIMRVGADGEVGIGTTDPNQLLHVEKASALTNTVQQVLRLAHITSGTPANNIGVGLEFEQETAADNNEVIAAIEALAIDVTAGSEDGALVFKTMKAGAAVTEDVRISASGLQGIIGNVTPAAGTFTDLTASGQILVKDGTQSSPSIGFSTNPDVGYHYDAGNDGGVVTTINNSKKTFIYQNSTRLISSMVFGWSSGDPQATGHDTALSRNAAGVMEINSGTAGTYRDLTLRTLAPDKMRISNTTEGKTASMNIQTARELHTLAAAGTSDTTTISIPSGAMVLGASFCVNTAVVDSAGDDTWSAAFITGDTSTLGTAEAAAQNTKVNTLVAPAITTDVTQIRFTANGGNFSAGVIEIIAYYIDTTSLADV